MNDPLYLAALRKGMMRAKQNKNSTLTSSERVYEEYNDGDIYQTLHSHGPLKWSHIFSFSLFVDGMRLFRHKKSGCTAVYLVNTMLPLEERFKDGNIIVVALCSSNINLPYHKFLDHVITEVRNTLQLKGIRVELNGEEVYIGGLITSVVLDIKERDACLLMNAGRFRCPCCYQRGCTYSPNPSVYFPFKDQDMLLRTKLSFDLDATIGKHLFCYLTLVGSEGGDPMRGVKGYSPLLKLDRFDPTTMVPVEVMHTFDLGIIPLLLNAWCAGILSADQYQELVQRVNAVRVPHTITRKPNLETRDDWKAEEFRTFCLVMSEEVLYGLLPHEYYIHWCTFVQAYRILSKKCIYGWEIDLAERLLRDFYEGVELLYGEDFCTIKVHQLIHAGTVVRNFGPLSNVSSYRYEDINGRIVKMNLAKLSPIEQLHIKFQRINWI
jgi:hypothetical protein